MKRLSLINNLIAATDFKTYLEIGCYKGRTFFKVNAKTKIAVDPSFHRHFYVDLAKQFFRNKSKTYVCKKTSDFFFEKNTQLLNKIKPIDIAVM